MRNAHLRFGTLQFHKVARDTTVDVHVGVDRLILECGADSGMGRAHLISIFGGDQDVSAIAAAITEQATFIVNGPDLAPMRVTLGDDAQVFRGSITTGCFGGQCAGLHRRLMVFHRLDGRFPKPGNLTTSRSDCL